MGNDDDQQPAPQKEITTTQDALNAFGPRHPKKPPETPPQDPETAVPTEGESFDGEEPDFFDDEPVEKESSEAEPDFDDADSSTGGESSEKEPPKEESDEEDDEPPSELDASDLFNLVNQKEKQAG